MGVALARSPSPVQVQYKSSTSPRSAALPGLFFLISTYSVYFTYLLYPLPFRSLGGRGSCRPGEQRIKRQGFLLSNRESGLGEGVYLTRARGEGEFLQGQKWGKGTIANSA